MTSAIKLIIGLGNPGEKYAGNRHNIGFMAIDHIADAFNASPFKAKYQGLISEFTHEETKVLLLKPQTYMNESGRCAQAAAKFFKIKPEDTVVLYDELDLPPFKVKVKKGGGSGGHNGIKSLDAHLSSKEYWRVRMGIGHPGDKAKVTPYVLSDFFKAEQNPLGDFLDANTKYLSYLLDGNENDYMTYMSEYMAERTK